MQRILIPVGALAVIAIAVWILMYEPKPGSVVPAAPVTVASTAAPTEAPEAPVTIAPKTAAPPTAPEPVDAGLLADAAKPTGPVDINLGAHTISMRDSKKRLQVELVMTVDNPVTLREVRSKRRNLVRMLFFLSAHRVEDGMLGGEGKARFLADLRERFGNVIRTGDIKDLRFTRYEVVDPPTEPK